MKCKLDSFSILLRDIQVETYEQEDSSHVTSAVIISTLHLTWIKHGHI